VPVLSLEVSMQTVESVPVRQLRDLPAPRGVPLLGNALQLDPARLHLLLEQWGRELGETFSFGLGPQRVYVSSNPEHLQTALRERPERYRRFSPIEDIIKEMGFNGVFSVEGEAWRPQRRLVMQALAPNNFRGFFGTIHDITERLRRRWQQAAEQGWILEMTEELTRYTVDVTTALSFGEDPNTIDAPGDVIQDHLARVFPTLNARINAPFPWWRYLRLPSDRRFDASLAAVRHHIEGLIQRARQRMQDQPAETPRHLLEAMLKAADEPGSGIDDTVVAANVMTLLLAGEDTTAHTLAWTMYFMASDAALQSRLQASALECLGARRVCPDLDAVKTLDLFEAAANEATRLKSTIPLIFLETVKDVVLGDVALPAGTPLFFMLRPSMQDPGHFGRPGEFVPERWTAGHETVQPHDNRAFVQFGAGPRVCPGRHLAGVELRLVLSMLARNFTLEHAGDPADIREVMAFTMKPSTLPMRLRTVSPV
jgi:cytochrome P450